MNLKKSVNLSKKPINQNSLQSLELWLTDLGAVKDVNNPSKWYLLLSNWNATIIFEQEDLSVIWDSKGPVSYTHLTLPTILLV